VFINFEEKAKREGVNFPFYFHAGETRQRSKEGVYDALMFNTKRIGHGISVMNHPNVAQELRERGICVELNPISNMLLGYGKDLRTHPGWTLLSNGVPVSVSSDDPAIFCTKGGSYDLLWATISWDLSLAHLKKLAINSINSTEQSEMTMEIFQRKWDEFIALLASQNER
jgi:adenosine deaminase CECR1